MAKFVRTCKVRFEDCDPAGIVFYPNYFLMLNRLVEDWFSEALGLPWRVMHNDQRRGVPTASIKVIFKKASQLDDLLEWSLEVIKLGSKSITLGVIASCGGEERIEIETVLVHANLIANGVSPSDIPADIRAAMNSYLIDSKVI
jgi:4-hydroxybenzoyl-CoA thioesterase